MSKEKEPAEKTELSDEELEKAAGGWSWGETNEGTKVKLTNEAVQGRIAKPQLRDFPQLRDGHKGPKG